MKTLIIGSTVCDIMIHVDKLPQREGDIHISKQLMSLGGCAFNVAHLFHRLHTSHTFISPVGQGLYGQFVSQQIEELGMAPLIPVNGKNGCCYCFVEEDGERTFLSDHGVEYHFDASWVEGLDVAAFDYIYVCGLEIEEETGAALVAALETFEGQIIYCPGPRGHLIPTERMDRLYAQAPLLHLNEDECKRLSNQADIDCAAATLYHRTMRPIIITKGARGASIYNGQWTHVQGYPNEVVDTIGAGDSHAAAMMVALMNGYSLTAAIDIANWVASRIVATHGVHLTEEEYDEIEERLKNNR